MSNDPNDYLMGMSGAPAYKFERPGDTVKGEIVDFDLRQQTEIGTGAPLTWDDGQPMMQVVVTLQTDLRDDNDDDGLRRVFLKGGLKRPTTQRAVADAVRKAGAKKLETGGTLALRYTGDGEPTKRGFAPSKEYAASYRPPAAKAVSLDDELEPVAAAPAPAKQRPVADDLEPF